MDYIKKEQSLSKRNSIIIKIYLFFLIFTTNFALSYQDSSENYFDKYNITFGLFGDYIIPMYSADFQSIPNVPNCCPQFDNATGSGFSAGIMAEYLISKPISVGLALQNTSISANFAETENEIIKVDNEEYLGEFTHFIDADVFSYDVVPYIKYTLDFGMSFNIGLPMMFIHGSVYDQREEITDPEDRGVWVEEQSRIRNQNDGSIPDMERTNFGIMISADYKLPLNKRGNFNLMPRAGFTLVFNELNQQMNWSHDRLFFGLGIAFTPVKKQKQVDTLYKEYLQIDTVIVKRQGIFENKYKKGGGIITTNYTSEGKKIIISKYVQRIDTIFSPDYPNPEFTTNAAEIYIETEFLSETLPVLNYIFFKNRSDEITQNYIIKSDSKELLINSPLEMHNNTFQIIAERLKKFPKAKLFLKGFADLNSEDGDCELARKRSNKVISIFNEIYNIEKSRLINQTNEDNCSPDNPTKSENENGYADNRRVMLYSNEEMIFEPFRLKRKLNILEMTPANLEIDMNSQLYPENSKWEVIGSVNGKQVFLEKGKNIPKQLIVKPAIEPDEINGSDLSINYKIETPEGISKNSELRIPINMKINDIEKRRLSLLLFDVGSPELTKDSKRLLEEFLSESINPKEIMIYGYTDNLGIEEANKELSQARANAIKNYIQTKIPNANITSVIGYGSSKYPEGIKSYNSPPERFFSRTVYIEILNDLE